MVKKLPKRVKGVKKSSAAKEDDEKLPVQGFASVEAELNPAPDDMNTSYIEPHFDVAEPHFDTAKEAHTATSEADRTLVMDQTEESQEESPDTTQELQDANIHQVNKSSRNHSSSYPRRYALCWLCSSCSSSQ